MFEDTVQTKATSFYDTSGDFYLQFTGYGMKNAVTVMNMDKKTVHNPFFCLLAPLVSRLMVFKLKPLTEAEILDILRNTLKDKRSGLDKDKIKIAPEALKFLARSSEGDARRALSALGIGILTTKAAKDGFIYFTKDVSRRINAKKGSCLRPQ